MRRRVLREGRELPGEKTALPGDVSLRHRRREHPTRRRRADSRRLSAGARVYLRGRRPRLQLRAAPELPPAGGGAGARAHTRVLRASCGARPRRCAYFNRRVRFMKLRDPDLLRTRAFIGGKWLDAASGATHAVVNPATREPLGTVPDMGIAETRSAIEAASRAFPPWAALTAKERAAIL